MASEIVVHGFETSNNMKVRVALGYKGIPYEFRAVNPRERTDLVKISGQFLTPVLVHGDRVVFDSAAILRYLDVAFRDTPRLFGTSHEQQWEIEDWELFARAELAGPMMTVVHRRAYEKPVDDAMLARCTTTFDEACAKLAGGLDGSEWLVGDSMTAADITTAAVLHRIRTSELFPLPQAAEAHGPWIDKVMAYDGKHRVS